MIETQKTIINWARSTFGEASSCVRVAARANEEMAELLRALTADFIDSAKAAEEAADVVIVLFRVAELCGRDLLEEVDRKMNINRARKWKLSGDGHGYHVKTEG